MSATIDRFVDAEYDRLRTIARRLMGAERSDHTLTPTGLVHLAYLTFVRSTHLDVSSRSHLRHLFWSKMRQLLTDHARSRRARLQGVIHVGLQDAAIADPHTPDLATLLDLRKALETLRAVPRYGDRYVRQVELRFGEGRALDETASLMGLSPRTLQRDWNDIIAPLLYHALGRAA